jgi:Protein of unknown function (DUF2799)
MALEKSKLRLNRLEGVLTQMRNLVPMTLFGCALAGCAPISRESCINDSAYDIGRTAAMDNADQADRLRDVSKICSKQGREIDSTEYARGFDAGTTAFCVPDNGYRWGLKGRSYNGICADPAFGAAYDDGLRVFKIEERRVEIRDRLDAIRDRLAGIARQLDEDKTMSDERKRQLRREEDELLLERSDLLSEQRSLPSA